MKTRTLYYLLVIVLTSGLLTACTLTIQPEPSAAMPTAAPAEEEASNSSATPEQPAVGMPNPASENCTAQGGVLTIEQRGDGAEFGVCTFEDNRQCEEWALMRGQCPAGGIRVTGYLTPAARYCAITGGEYTDNGTTSADNEQGTCTFENGTTCPAADY